MRWTHKIPLRFRSLFRKTRIEQELSEELRFHFEALVGANVAKGMTAEQARYAALRELGPLEQLKEECRDARRVRLIESTLQDIRYGVRQLLRSPGFTGAAVLTLALGIGANTAVFSIISRVLLQPLPYPQPNDLVSLQESGRYIGNPVSYLDFFDWRSQNHVFTGMASYHSGEFTLTHAGEAAHLQAWVVSSDLFGVLEVKPVLGRGFEPQDDQRGADVVVLSNSLWRQRFGGAESIVGRSITLDSKSYTVIGVLPAGFQFPPNFRSDLWTSIAVDRESTSNIMTGRGYHVLSVIARLKPGISLQQARADMDLIARRLAQQHPDTNGEETSVRVIPEIDRIVGRVRPLLLVLLASVGLVLLIACVNVASLSLARNISRQREIALRAALGASRPRLFRQLLTESVVLSILGGLAGIALAAWGTRALLAVAPQDLPRMQDVGLDWRVLTFATALVFLTGLAFGSLPALQGTRATLVDVMKGAGPNVSQGVVEQKLRHALVVVQTSLALILLIAAGLLASSYLRLIHTDLGFNPHNLLTFKFDLPMPPYTEAKERAFVDELLSRIRRLPTVTSVATQDALPLSGGGSSTGVEFKASSYPSGTNPPSVALTAVPPAYFRTMGIPLLRGRIFTERDTAKSQPVVVVNEAFARTYFPNEDAVGRDIRPSFSTTSDFPWREIVGVVGNTKQESLAESFQPEFYFPFAQVPNFNALIVRTTGNPLDLAPQVRRIVASMDQNVPVFDIETMDDYLSVSVARNRFATLLLGLFGGAALLLAALGIYGVVSYSVTQGTREIGIRIALGCERGNLLKDVLSRGIFIASTGVAIGIAGALLLTRFLGSLLYEIQPTDTVTFTIVAVTLLAVALLASYIPARRATKVDPVVALRYE